MTTPRSSSERSHSSDRSLWPGSTWDRVCRELFDGDRRKMLAWGRRYLAAYPAVHGEVFHLGARFREIVGARNRLHWWRTAVELLSRRTVDVAAASHVAETTAANGAATSVAPAPSLALDAAERLRIFDLATERQRRRERGLPAEETRGESRRPSGERGWSREDLYE